MAIALARALGLNGAWYCRRPPPPPRPGAAAAGTVAPRRWDAGRGVGECLAAAYGAGTVPPQLPAAARTQPGCHARASAPGGGARASHASRAARPTSKLRSAPRRGCAAAEHALCVALREQDRPAPAPGCPFGRGYDPAVLLGELSRRGVSALKAETASSPCARATPPGPVPSLHAASVCLPCWGLAPAGEAYRGGGGVCGAGSDGGSGAPGPWGRFGCLTAPFLHHRRPGSIAQVP